MREHTPEWCGCDADILCLCTGVFHEAGTTLILPLELDEDMGQPEVITITVEPRDALNPCDCTCHQAVQPGLVPCPHCGDGMACL